MRRVELVGKVQTVLGIIDGDSLGVTLPHEHLLLDATAFFVEPTEASQRKLAHELVSLENLYWVKPHCLSHMDNMKLTDEQLAIKEAMLYKLAGGDTIVEMTNIGIHRDPLGLSRIARATGLNIVMGAGYYRAESHPPELATRTEQEIAEEIIRDIMVGADKTEVRAGFIGEIGCSLPLEEAERKVLRASAVAQQQTGAALNIHPSPSDDLGLEIIKILHDAGADLSRTIISHVDMFFSQTTRREIADAGCYLEFDCFGYADLFPVYHGRVLDTPSPTQRINDIIQHIADGYLNQILISGDICYKHMLVNYGGYGYAHILRDIVPLMRYKGISDEQIHTLLVENPKRVFPFAPVKQ